jgi:CTP:molybdopterin cytidylyltransferase MocA
VQPNESVTYVVLAAGRSSRMGFDKVSTPMTERTPLQMITGTLGRREFVVVMPSRSARHLNLPGATIRINDEPARGMAHSLRVGLAAVPTGRHFGVLLADMPAMTPEVLDRTESLLARGVDVAYPVDSNARPGHPVIFSASMRSVVQTLPDGDTLWRARDEARVVATWRCSDASAFLDLDTPGEWHNFRHA